MKKKKYQPLLNLFNTMNDSIEWKDSLDAQVKEIIPNLTMKEMDAFLDQLTSTKKINK